MSRWKAAGIHLGISVFVATIAASVIYFLWYPPPYFTISGGANLAGLIIGVDVVLGPCLTLAVFRAGKRGLGLDLAIIGAMQVTAFLYGVSVIAAARPVFIVGRVERFIVVAANDLDEKDLAIASKPEYASLPWTGPRLVGVVVPTDPKERSDLTLSAAGGRDIEKMPRYYVSYADAAQGILAHSHPLSDLAKKSDEAARRVADFLRGASGDDGKYRYVPLDGRGESRAMVLSAQSGFPLGDIAIDPW